MTHEEILRVREKDRERVFYAALVAAIVHYVVIMAIRVPSQPPLVLDVKAPENAVIIHANAPEGPLPPPPQGVAAPMSVLPAPVRPSMPGEMPPRVLELAAPVVPEAARQAHVRGVVTLDVLVRQDGSAADIQVRAGLTSALDQAAVDAVRRSRFAAGSVGGKPVDAVLAVEIRFP